MKSRNGFVSNSSSSSFILIGKKISFKEAFERANNHKCVTVIGKELWDGQDVFDLDVEMSNEIYNELSTNEWDSKYDIFDFYIPVYLNSDAGGETLSVKSMNIIEAIKVNNIEDLVIITDTKQQSSSNCVKDLRERYK